MFKRKNYEHENFPNSFDFFQHLLQVASDPKNIDLSNGDPYCLPPSHIKTIYSGLISKILVDNNDNESTLDLHKYWQAPFISKLLLQAAINHFKKNGLPITQDLHENNLIRYEVAVGAGVTHLMAASIHALTNAGESVVTNWPYYSLFQWAAEVNGNVIDIINPDEKNDYKLSLENLEKYLTINPKCRCLIITNPNNPTGAVYTYEEYERLSHFLLDSKHKHVNVIVDEVYEKTDFDINFPFISLASLPGMFERCITLTGFSKNMGLAKERIGIAGGPSHLIASVTKYIIQTTGGISLLTQNLVAELLNTTTETYFTKTKQYYAAQLNCLDTQLKILNNVLCTHFSSDQNFINFTHYPKAGFFACLVCKGLLGKKNDTLTINNDMDLFSLLLDKGQVVVLPCSLQGFNPTEMVIRINISISREQLEESFKRITKALLTLDGKL